jgi:predicted enzyme related to lactoylglutathione lyase
MARPIHFEIEADDPVRAAAFYESAFGWIINEFGGGMPYWMITTGLASEQGINGGMRRRDPAIPHPVCNVIGVESIDSSIEKIISAGGKIAVPKMEVPTVGYLAYFTDTEGNWFGLIEPFGG